MSLWIISTSAYKHTESITLDVISYFNIHFFKFGLQVNLVRKLQMRAPVCLKINTFKEKGVFVLFMKTIFSCHDNKFEKKNHIVGSNQTKQSLKKDI